MTDCKHITDTDGVCVRCDQHVATEPAKRTMSFSLGEDARAILAQIQNRSAYVEALIVEDYQRRVMAAPNRPGNKPTGKGK